MWIKWRKVGRKKTRLRYEGVGLGSDSWGDAFPQGLKWRTPFVGIAFHMV